MELIQHTINWCKGEIFEGKMSLLFGVIVVIVSLAYWKFASTPYAKSMFIPLLVVALLCIGAGVYLMSTNQSRIPTYTEAFETNQEQFIQAEKERTEAFIKWYPYTRYMLLVVMLVGIFAMILSDGALIRAIGIGLMLLSFYGFVLDHFSEERAKTYHLEITRKLNPE